jgi:hypothetical protein
MRRVLLVALLLALPLTARADGGAFGLGIILGSPSGVSAKLYLSQKHAVDFALGWSILGAGGLTVHADYLWHPLMIAEDEAFFLPLYFGVGGRFVSRNRSGSENDELRIGARVPVGILFDFRRIPLDVFLEVALLADFIQDRDDDDTGFIDLSAGIGARYYF